MIDDSYLDSAVRIRRTFMNLNIELTELSQLKDELFNCPPILVITGRVQDAWLAGWSRADGVVTHPIDPFTIATTVVNLLKNQATLPAL